MSTNVFLNLPVPTSNSAGAAVDTSTLAASKTIIVGGSFAATVTIEYSTAPSGNLWAPVPGGSFQGAGRVTIPLAVRRMRAVTSNYVSGAPNADVGAPFAVAGFVQLTGVSADISALPAFKTVTVSGACIVEVSEDGLSYSQVFAFGQAGAQSAIVTGQFARVTDGVTCWMGGADMGVDVTETFATRVVFRPDDPLGTHANVFVTWAETYAALRTVNGLGQVFLEFDDRFSSPCHIPAGIWVMDNVIWVNASKGSIPTVVELDDGCSIRVTTVGPTLTIDGNAMLVVSDRVGPIAPFSGINLVLAGVRTRIANTSGLALPMVVTGGVGAFVFVAIPGSNNFGGIGNAAACPAPLIDCEGGSVLIGGGAGFVCDNAFTDSVGGGDVFVRLMDDGFNGGSTGGQNYLFPAAAGIVTLGVQSRDRHLVQDVVTAVTASPYVATFNELVRVDTSAVAITVNAPSAKPATGERLVVKDTTGNAAVHNITIAPSGLDVVESPTISTNFQSKTWVSDGAGTWMLTSVAP